MAIHDEQERRADTVPISRQTAKALTWLASICFLAVAGFVWDGGNKLDALIADLRIVDLRVVQLEQFATQGGRFTSDDGDKISDRIEAIRLWQLEMQKSINQHLGQGEHLDAGRRLNRIEQWNERHEKLHHANGHATGVRP